MVIIMLSNVTEMVEIIYNTLGLFPCHEICLLMRKQPHIELQISTDSLAFTQKIPGGAQHEKLYNLGYKLGFIGGIPSLNKAQTASKERHSFRNVSDKSNSQYYGPIVISSP